MQSALLAHVMTGEVLASGALLKNKSRVKTGSVLIFRIKWRRH